jgi:FkbM family methyltransferase
MDIYEILSKKSFTSNIIECGGHLGTDTFKLSKIFNNATIHCLEANPNLYKNLIKNNNFNNLKLYNYALSDKNEPISFYIDKNPLGDAGASSILQASAFYLNNHIKNEEKITVDGIKLSDFCINENITDIDLLWLDIEGFEYYVLKSSEDFLKNIKYIYTEVNFQEFRKNTKLYRDIRNFLNDNNFEEINQWTQGDEWGKWQGNVLFRNKK